MDGTFWGCSTLESLDLADWDTSHVTEMDGLFCNCSGLKELSLAGWETSQVTSCGDMYNSVWELEVFTVGSGVHFHDEFQTGATAKYHTGSSDNWKSDWWSSKAEKWIGYDEIASTRSGIADTYAKKEGQGKPPESEPRTWKRLAGSGRYDTMAAIVQEGWKSSSNTVIVATGNNFKDALSAAGLAGLKSAPVVLTDGGKGDKVTKLSPQAKSELQRLAPRTVYVVGGPFAVSDAVMADIQATLPSARVDRVSGSTAASTSAAIATEEYWDWEDTAIIATNKSFKDALSVAPLSYAKHWPILLADNGQSLNADVIDALKQCGIKQVYIVGGKLAVTDKVESQLIKAGVAIAGRLAGLDGVHTSRAIADFAIKNGLSVSKMAFATSQNFPDALAGAALCGKNNSVLLLCDAKAQYNLSFAKTHKDNITTGYVFGGTYAFSESLFKSLP
jgi:lactocepin